MVTLEVGHGEAVSALRVGGIEYRAVRQRGSSALRLVWRFRVTRAGRWFACGELIPEGATYAVRGWDGEPIGRVRNVRDGLEAVRSFYNVAEGSSEQRR